MIATGLGTEMVVKVFDRTAPRAGEARPEEEAP